MPPGMASTNEVGVMIERKFSNWRAPEEAGKAGA